MSSDHFVTFAAAAVCALCIAVLSPLLGAPLLFDDEAVVGKDPFVAAFVAGRAEPADAVRGLWFQPRPVRILSHRLDAIAFRGRLAGPHAENVALHVAVGLLFFALLRAIGVPDGTRLAALALFLLHPVCVESVGVLSHRKEILAALFLLGALHLALSERKAVRALAVPVLFLAAFSKETAAVFPALWLVAASERSRRAGATFRLRGATLGNLAAWTAVSGVLAALAWLQIRHGMAVLRADPSLDPFRAGHFPGGAPWGLACSAAIRAFPRYLAGFLVPWEHSVDPAFDLGVPPSSARTLGAAAVWILYGAALAAARRRRSRFFAPLAWIPLALSPYLFPPLLRNGGTAAFCDRYAYLAAPGFAWLAAEAACAAAARAGLRGWRAAALAAASAAVLAGCTLAEALDFRSGPAFWRRACRWNPDSFQSRHNLAWALWKEADDREGARREFERMRRLRPDFAFGMANYADFLVDDGKTGEALAVLEEGLRKSPGDRRLLGRRPAVLLDEGLYTSALKACRAAKDVCGDSPAFQFVFAEACRDNLLWPEALRLYRKAAEGDRAYAAAAAENAVLASDPEPPAGARGIAVAGDSVPHGTDALGPDRPGRPLADRIAERLGVPARDFSVPGSLAGDLPGFAEERATGLPEPPRWLVVMTGHNDAIHGIPPTAILFQIADCVRRARRAGMRVLVVGPIAVEDTPEKDRKEQERILSELDARLSSFCASAHVAFVSSRLGLPASEAPPDGWVVRERGNHLVDAGLDRIAGLCAEAIREAERD